MESHEKDLRSEVSNATKALAVQEDYQSANLSGREVALLDYAVKLTKSPTSASREDLEILRRHGFSDAQLVDAVQCIGYFNFINRVLDGLGVDPEVGMRYAPWMAPVPASRTTGSGGNAMPHLQPLDNQAAGDDARATLEKLQARLGQVPNMYRTIAHAPKVLDAVLAMGQAIRSDLAPSLRELAYLKVSQITDCHV